MKKKLYLWNDLPLLYDKYYVEDIWLHFQQYINNHGYNDVDYHCIDDLNLRNWLSKIDLNSNKVLSIGTRPNLFLNILNKSDYVNIKPVRQHGRGGESQCVSISLKDQRKLQEVVQNEPDGKICIVEDVLVNGDTNKYILDELNRVGFVGQLLLNIFIVNDYSLNCLDMKFQYDVILNIGIYMDGKPIEDSTCICFHDLLFGKLCDGKKYYERMDLMTRFLYNKDNSLIKIIEECQRRINNGTAKELITE